MRLDGTILYSPLVPDMDLTSAQSATVVYTRPTRCGSSEVEMR